MTELWHVDAHADIDLGLAGLIDADIANGADEHECIGRQEIETLAQKAHHLTNRDLRRDFERRSRSDRDQPVLGLGIGPSSACGFLQSDCDLDARSDLDAGARDLAIAQ